MTRRTRVLYALLVFAPILVGEAAPQKREIRDEMASSSHAVTRVVRAPSQPTQAAIQGEKASVPMPANSATGYALDWYSINGGGSTNASSTNYQLGASIGQSVAGAANSTNYQMGIGFWYGAGSGCACPCKYDPQCDGVISDVLDVSLTINRAFRGAASLQDPTCPKERTDVDASGATDVLDVTKVINVAFRGQAVASNYVDPCVP